MKILFAHNTYQHQGGEDSVVDSEITLLREHGHEVATYFRNNNDIVTMPAVKVAIQTLWSSTTVTELTALINLFKPDVIHVHNTMPLISPAVYWAANRAGVPIVQTLHNFRLNCISALYLRENKICENCVGHLPWRGIKHKCYRRSTADSFVLASMLTLHRSLGTYKNKVSRYIVFNEFCRNKFIQGGLPADLLTVKPNFIDAPLPLELPRHGILFVGRLSIEKGIESLAKAADLLPDPQLRVVGQGSMELVLERIHGVTKLGQLSSSDVLAEMSKTIAVVVPSIWYETFGMVVIEAYASGTPVIASRIGALADIVIDGETGLLFDPGNAQDLADKMAWALNHPEQMAIMGQKARAVYEEKYTSAQNYSQLINIYKSVINQITRI